MTILNSPLNYKRNKDFLIAFVVFFCAILTSYADFLYDIANSDHMPGYASANQPMVLNWRDIIAGGRYVSVIIDYIYKLLRYFGVTHYANTYVIQILGMLFFAAAATLIYSIFLDYINIKNRCNHFVYGLSILIAFINPFMIETYKFHSFDFAFGVFFAVTAVFLWSKRKLFLSVLFTVMAFSAYETNIFIILIMMLFLVLIQSIEKDVSFKEFLRLQFKSVVICIGMAGLIFAFQRMAISLINSISNKKSISAVKKVDVSFGIDRIWSSVKTALRIVFTCWGMLPKGVLPIFGVIVITIICIVAKRDKKTIFEFVFVTILCGVSTFSLLLLGAVYFQRMLLSLFFIVALVCTFLLFILDYYHISESKYKTIVDGIVVFMFMIIFINTQICITDAYTAQAIDIYEAKFIEREIEGYEQESGNIITTIASCGGAGYNSKLGGTYYYPGLLKHYSFPIPYQRIPYYQWSQGEYINYVNNTDYKCRMMTDEEIDSMFNGETEGYFNPETQLKFKGDTLYWRVY